MHERINSNAPVGERVASLEACYQDLDKRVNRIEFFERDSTNKSAITVDRVLLVFTLLATLISNFVRH